MQLTIQSGADTGKTVDVQGNEFTIGREAGADLVLAESYERIHRSNLVGMGVLPLQFPAGETRESLGLSGHETFDVGSLEDGQRTVRVNDFEATVRIDTPNEWGYYRAGGILPYVLRKLS